MRSISCDLDCGAYIFCLLKHYVSQWWSIKSPSSSSVIIPRKSIYIYIHILLKGCPIKWGYVHKPRTLLHKATTWYVRWNNNARRRRKINHPKKKKILSTSWCRKSIQPQSVVDDNWIDQECSNDLVHTETKINTFTSRAHHSSPPPPPHSPHSPHSPTTVSAMVHIIYACGRSRDWSIISSTARSLWTISNVRDVLIHVYRDVYTYVQGRVQPIWRPVHIYVHHARKL